MIDELEMLRTIEHNYVNAKAAIKGAKSMAYQLGYEAPKSPQDFGKQPSQWSDYDLIHEWRRGNIDRLKAERWGRFSETVNE